MFSRQLLAVAALAVAVLATSVDDCSCGFYDTDSQEVFTESIIVYFNETTSIPADSFAAVNYTHTKEEGWSTLYRTGATTSNAMIGNTSQVSWLEDADNPNSLELFIDPADYKHLVVGGSVESIRRDILYGTFRASMRSPHPWAGGSSLSMEIAFNETQTIQTDLLNSGNPAWGFVSNILNDEGLEVDNGVNYTVIEAAGESPWNYMDIKVGWTKTGVNWTVNGNRTRTVDKKNATSPGIPEAGCPLIFNHWSTGLDTYTFGPPNTRTGANVAWVRAFFNSSSMTTLEHEAFDARCDVSMACSADNMTLRGSSAFGDDSTVKYKYTAKSTKFRVSAAWIAELTGALGGLLIVNAIFRRHDPVETVRRWNKKMKNMFSAKSVIEIKEKVPDLGSGSSSTECLDNDSKSTKSDEYKPENEKSKVTVSVSVRSANSSRRNSDATAVDSAEPSLDSRPGSEGTIYGDGPEHNLNSNPVPKIPNQFLTVNPFNNSSDESSLGYRRGSEISPFFVPNQRNVTASGDAPEHTSNSNAAPMFQPQFLAADDFQDPFSSPGSSRTSSPGPRRQSVTLGPRRQSTSMGPRRSSKVRLNSLGMDGADDEITPVAEDTLPGLDSAMSTRRPNKSRLNSIARAGAPAGHLTAMEEDKPLVVTIQRLPSEATISTDGTSRPVSSAAHQGPTTASILEREHRSHTAAPWGIQMTMPFRRRMSSLHQVFTTSNFGTAGMKMTGDAHVVRDPVNVVSVPAPQGHDASATVVAVANQRVDYLAGYMAFASVMVTLVHFGLTFLPAVSEDGDNYHYKSEITARNTIAPFIFMPIWIGPFFTTSARFLAARYLVNGKLADMANKVLLRGPRLLIPVIVCCALEYFIIALGGTYWMEYLCSISYSTWPYVTSYKNFGDFLNDIIDMSYLIPNGAPLLINNYCIGVLWTIPVQLQNSWLVILGAIMAREIKNPWKRFSFYAFCIANTWYAYSWSSCFWGGLMLADLEVSYKWTKRVRARPWIHYPLITLLIALSLFGPIVILINNRTTTDFDMLEQGIHIDATTGQLLSQTSDYGYPLYYNPTLTTLVFSVSLQALVELSTWLQAFLSMRVWIRMFPHMMNIYLLHGLVFWTLGGYMCVRLAELNVPYWANMLCTFIACYLCMAILLRIMTPMLNNITARATKNIWRWASEEPVEKITTLMPYGKELLVKEPIGDRDDIPPSSLA